MPQPPADHTPSPAWRLLGSLCLAAALLLGVGLGGRALWGSEGRWAEVTREMLANGDFLHPRINGAPYFDKPLGSYWPIAGLAWLRGGVLDEFACRLPSAAAALLAVLATFLLGRRLWPGRTGLAAAWLLLTAYGVVFWGRAAAADMANVAAIVAAVACYMQYKERPGFPACLGFWAICAVGAHMKGMAALVIPPALAGLDALLEGSWRRHLRLSAALAALAGAGLYLLPFALAAWTRGSYSASGLRLALTENLVRYFQPFDHQEPFYVYLYYVPLLFLPWAPLLVVALAWAARRCHALPHPTRWLLLANAAVFALFTLSGSRRSYYILPLLPFCALLCAAWLEAPEPGWLGERARRLLWRVYDVLLVAGGIALVLSPLAWGVVRHLSAFVPPRGLAALLCTSGVALLALWWWLRRAAAAGRAPAWLPGPEPALGRTVLCVWLGLFVLFGLVLPRLDTLRTERPFARELRTFVAGIPPVQVVFYPKVSPELLFYLALPEPVTLVETPEALRARLAPGQPPAVVVTQRRYAERLPADLRDALLTAPDLEEARQPWGRDAHRKFYATGIAPGPRTSTAAAP